jgi:hypothetical protein
VAHQLVEHPGRDAVVLQPGREGVPEVMWAAQVQAEQVAVRPGLAERPQVGVPQAVAGPIGEQQRGSARSGADALHPLG